MRVLVTGGCGFIGSNLVTLLQRQGYKLSIVDNLSTGRKEYLESLTTCGKVEVLIGDIRDQETLDRATEGVEAVIHLAAQANVEESLKNPTNNWDININGTLYLLEMCRQKSIQKFIYASSSAVLGEQVPFDETEAPKPMSLYGASKLSGEALCSAYYRSFGLKTISLRFSNCYGPYSNHKNDVITNFLRHAKEGKKLIIYGAGEQTRDFIHVYDLCHVIMLAMTACDDIRNPVSAEETVRVRALATYLYGSVLHVGTGIETSINELVEIFRDVTRINLEVLHLPERRGDIKNSHSDITKATTLLGFKPLIQLKEGLNDLWTH